MRRNLQPDLPKLGSRPYVQGGTLFNAMVDACDEVLGSAWLSGATITSFKLQRESFANGTVCVADEPLPTAEANAVLNARCGTGEITVTFVDCGRETRREPYDEESYYETVFASDDLAGEFLLTGRDRADFIRGVIGANKLLHQRADGFAGTLQQIQFVYLKELAGACLERRSERLRLRIANLMRREQGSEVWTINRVDVEAPSFSSAFRLCYRSAQATES